MSGALSCYRRQLALGRRYSLPAYAMGATLRHRFTRAGALAWVGGLPTPSVHAGAGTIVAGDIGLYPGVKLACEPGAHIEIGDGTYLNRRTLVHARRRVTIGCETMIAWDVIHGVARRASKT
jgi:hypothetical protein